MNQCRYCGQKIQVGAPECEHCGKTLVKQKADEESGVGLTNIESWQGKSVPAWVMYLVLAIFAVFVVLLIVKGCDTTDTGEQANALRIPLGVMGPCPKYL